jgi:hypothetical protein
MTWKQIEISREIRLWITQIAVPVVAAATAVVVAVPEVREKVATKFEEAKNSFKCKFHK